MSASSGYYRTYDDVPGILFRYRSNGSIEILARLPRCTSITGPVDGTGYGDAVGPVSPYCAVGVKGAIVVCPNDQIRDPDGVIRPCMACHPPKPDRYGITPAWSPSGVRFAWAVRRGGGWFRHPDGSLQLHNNATWLERDAVITSNSTRRITFSTRGFCHKAPHSFNGGAFHEQH